MRYDVADFTKIIHIVYIIILHAVEKNFCNLPSSFKATGGGGPRSILRF